MGIYLPIVTNNFLFYSCNICVSDTWTMRGHLCCRIHSGDKCTNRLPFNCRIWSRLSCLLCIGQLFLSHVHYNNQCQIIEGLSHWTSKWVYTPASYLISVIVFLIIFNNYFIKMCIHLLSVVDSGCSNCWL